MSSRTSASSSTSDPGWGEDARPLGEGAFAAGPAGRGGRLLGWLRLTHPFPSVLDGVVSGGVALVAGGAAGTAVALGASMTLLQLGIGAVNDVVDAPRDAGRKTGKPIPAGLVRPSAARAAAVVLFGAGLAVGLAVRPAVAALGVLVVGIGLAYDLRLKGTTWSWLPFAIGIPVLPVYGWIGAVGSLDPAFAVLVPVAVVAGAALAIGNALVDVERDRAAGVSSIALAMGEGAAVRIQTVLFAAIWAAALATAFAAGATVGELVGLAALGAVPVVTAAMGRGRTSAGRERAWQAEAVGLAILVVVWLGVVLLETRSA